MQEFKIASNGGGQLRCGLWTPEGEAKAVVQIIHGIAEHIGRYDDFANFLTALPQTTTWATAARSQTASTAISAAAG